ncbi:MAG: CPBP family intramembrane metalloprotease [Lachnospiraceae bacterium]|nr:CPBP family intramembrane metalloprotease [Lachnospiraceae bacterium]
MKKTEYDRRKIIKYLVFTFGVAYAIQIGVYYLYKSGIPFAYQALMAAMMFVPFFGVLISGYSLKGMGWKPVFKGNMKVILFAWVGPAILTALGALIYFLIFPQHFDLSGSYLTEAAGEEALRQMEAAGISYPIYILITCIGCITYIPLMNMIAGLGEEVGWRGFLYPQLKARFGRRTGWVLGGVIWGVWHWPLIWLIGYEYGQEYFGFPVVGMLLFAVVTVALGIIIDRIYEKTGCIWLPSLFHGAFNAATTVTLAVCLPGTGSARLLGPAPNGLLAGMPLFATALILFLKRKALAENEESDLYKDN